VPCSVHDDGGRLLDGRARILLVTTAFFSTTATVIPVLLIAGILSPAVLRDYSRYRKTAVLLEIQIGTALLGTIAAIIGVVLSGGEGAPQWAIVAAYVLTWSGIVTGIGFLFLTAHTALHEHPHPDRLQSQANDIRNRLALIESRQSQQSVEEAQY
jgi:predicted membrane protein